MTERGALKRIQWTAEMNARIGTESDVKVAKVLGVSLTSVTRQRKRTGIPLVHRRSFSKRVIARLGKDSDRALADEFGIPLTTLTEERLRRGIAPATCARGRVFAWTPEMDRLLGTEPDPVLAERFQCGSSTVRRRRLFLGKQAHDTRSITWTTAMLAELGQLPDKILATQWNIHPYTIALKRLALGRKRCRMRIAWTAERLKALGTRSDTVLEKLWGLGKAVVTRKRHQLGIPGKNERFKRVVPADMKAQLGKTTDRQLAQKVGIPAHTIRAMRKSCGIPPWEFWTAERLQVLATRPDAELARLWNIAKRKVGHRRRKLGREPYDEHCHSHD